MAAGAGTERPRNHIEIRLVHWKRIEEWPGCVHKIESGTLWFNPHTTQKAPGHHKPGDRQRRARLTAHNRDRNEKTAFMDGSCITKDSHGRRRIVKSTPREKIKNGTHKIILA